MADKILVVVLSGRRDIFRARQALLFAKNCKKTDILKDVRVLFFGPGVELLDLEEDEFRGVHSLIDELRSEEVIVSACIANVREMNLEKSLEDGKINPVGAALYISDLVREGYEVVTF